MLSSMFLTQHLNWPPLFGDGLVVGGKTLLCSNVGGHRPMSRVYVNLLLGGDGREYVQTLV